MQGSKLYVGNLDYSVSTEELEQLFSNYGVVKGANIIEGRGFGFVEMADEGSASAAIQGLNGTEFEGRTLKVNEARERSDRDSGPRY